jgi:hypothetical protein
MIYINEAFLSYRKFPLQSLHIKGNNYGKKYIFYRTPLLL